MLEVDAAPCLLRNVGVSVIFRCRDYLTQPTYMKTQRSEFWTAFFTGMVAGFTAALAAATIYAVIYAKAQIEAAHREAQVEHLLTLEQQYEREPLATYRKRLGERRLKGEDEPDELYKVLDFFETVGKLVDRGYLDESDVWDNFAYPVLMLNADAGAIIRDYQQSDPSAYEGFTSLVKKLQQTESQHSGALQHISPNDIQNFYREELAFGTRAPIKLRGHPPAKR